MTALKGELKHFCLCRIDVALVIVVALFAISILLPEGLHVYATAATVLHTVIEWLHQE